MRQIRTGEELSAAVIAPARFLTVLMSSFAAIALLLTVAGLYGVLSYMVARRRREIGVRIALGAGRREVIGIVWRRAALLVTAGLILGSAGAFAVGRLLANRLVGLPEGIPLSWPARAARWRLPARWRHLYRPRGPHRSIRCRPCEASKGFDNYLGPSLFR